MGFHSSPRARTFFLANAPATFSKRNAPTRMARRPVPTHDSARRAGGRAPSARSLARDPQLLAAVLDHTTSLVLVLDRAGRVVLFNRACEQLTGYGAAEVVGRPLWDLLLSPEDAAQARVLVEGLGAGAFPGSHESAWLTRAGERRQVAWANTIVCSEAGDVRFVVGIGSDVTGASATERDARALVGEQGARHAAEAAADRLEHILESIADGFFATDPQWRLTYVNREAERFLALGREDVLGRMLWDVVPTLRRTIFEDECRTALRDGVAREFDAYYPPSQRWFGCRLYPASGGLSVFFEDVTRRKRAQQSQRFLAEAGDILSSSLDYQTTLQAVARLAVEGVAEICIVDVVERDGTVRRLELAHADPEKQELAAELRSFPLDRASPHLVFRVLETGRPELVPLVPESYLHDISQNERHLELLRALDIHSHMIVPMIARGRTIGVITFVRRTGARPYDAEDLRWPRSWHAAPPSPSRTRASTATPGRPCSRGTTSWPRSPTSWAIPCRPSSWPRR